MTPITLYHIDPGQNMQRFYYMDIQQDLFGNQCLFRVWGRIGRHGQMRAVPYTSEAEAEIAASKVIAAKQRKGYAMMMKPFSSQTVDAAQQVLAVVA